MPNWEKEPWFSIKEFFVSIGLYLLIFVGILAFGAIYDLGKKLLN